MRFIPLARLEDSNVFLRRDYTYDYRGSYVPAALHLERPTIEQLNAAFSQIREELAAPLETLREIYTSAIDGKHILLYGPPGTGKTTLARLVAEKLFSCDSRFETAVADWTPFETVGGLRLTSREGRESLEPVPGVITEAIVACLNKIADRAFGEAGAQGVWLVLDEMNRANMDAAFGQIFTALDQQHPEVSLPFFDDSRRRLSVPGRFRIIGTMNTYDKNFLFRLSYALTRRFALIPVDVPQNDDVDARQDERAKLWAHLHRALRERDIRDDPPEQLTSEYDELLMKPLYDELITAIRAPSTDPSRGLGRSIGFAQIATALRYAVFEVELGLIERKDILGALDRGVRAGIVPQLEGLSNTALSDFLEWWENHDTLKGMVHSMSAVRDLMRGAGLFLTE